ncbi:MAG TPA: hypothetical protein VMG39_06415 [Pseudolabrys sp.]|nr:hypothetical protein [Pseudolabrys sp.]
MRNTHRPDRSTALVLALLALALAACSTGGPQFPNLFGTSQEPQQPQPAAVPTLPPAFPPQDIVGRWGLAAYHKDEDRPRIEAAAAQQCTNPYVITLGPTGGVMMHLADQATPSELSLKGAPGGKTYIGPPGDPPGSAQDREVVSFDGRVLILRWMDAEVQGRYGTMVYVRCGPEGAKRPAKPKTKPKPKPTPQPKPKAAPAPKPVQPPVQQQ